MSSMYNICSNAGIISAVMYLRCATLFFETHDNILDTDNLVALECPNAMILEGGKPENPEKNPRSSGDINCGNS